MIDSTLVYEVNIRMDPKVKSPFLKWLKKHIKEMEQLVHFHEGTEVWLSQDGALSLISVRYFPVSQKALDEYFSREAPQMRATLPEKWRESLQFERRVLHLVDL